MWERWGRPPCTPTRTNLRVMAPGWPEPMPHPLGRQGSVSWGRTRLLGVWDTVEVERLGIPKEIHFCFSLKCKQTSRPASGQNGRKVSRLKMVLTGNSEIEALIGGPGWLGLMPANRS